MHPELCETATIHQLFEEQVARSGNRMAVKFENLELSYATLNSRANSLAMHLIETGVVRGDVVALLMDASIETIVAILAILKAGAAYLPLDKNNPLARQVSCLREADVKTLIGTHPVREIADLGITWVDASDKQIFENRVEENPALPSDKEDRAYVMFTSGSTGIPKGVMVPHRAVARLVKKTNYIQVNPIDRILQFAPLSFDASTFEIWGALLNGAGLVLYSGQGLDPNLFAREVADNKVSILWLTAALFHLFATRYLKVLKPLHTLLAGGDVLNPKLINKVLDEYPELTIINGYGPTENTTFTCCHRITTDNRPDDSVPIGKAISGTNIHILNDLRQAVAPGEVGELFASGPGVALGYVGSREQNNLFFFDSSISEGLIYRTGDLVKENPSGEIEFIGRKDNQIKIRGFRVSIEEIQNSILKLNHVDEALVLLDTFESGDQRLVAYLQLNRAIKITPAEIKQQLAEFLPRYMIPDLVHINQQLPISKNGKLDKKNLQTKNLDAICNS